MFFRSKPSLLVKHTFTIMHNLRSLPVSQFLPAYPLLQMHSLGRLQ